MPKFYKTLTSSDVHVVRKEIGKDNNTHYIFMYEYCLFRRFLTKEFDVVNTQALIHLNKIMNKGNKVSVMTNKMPKSIIEENLKSQGVDTSKVTIIVVGEYGLHTQGDWIKNNLFNSKQRLIFYSNNVEMINHSNSVMKGYSPEFRAIPMK